MLIHRYAVLASNWIRHVLSWKRHVSMCKSNLTNCADSYDEYSDDRAEVSRTFPLTFSDECHFFS